MEVGPQIHNEDGLWGPISIIVVYMVPYIDALGKGFRGLRDLEFNRVV